jgi:hypothetical protein
MIRSSKKALSRRRMVIALDKAARFEIVVERDREICQRCGQVQGAWDAEIQQPVRIQWAHVHTREYYVTRWEPDNSLALCSRCHVWFDNHKVLSYDWFMKNWPLRWQAIQIVLQGRGKVNVKILYEEMKAAQKELPPGREVKYMSIDDSTIPF